MIAVVAAAVALQTGAGAAPDHAHRGGPLFATLLGANEIGTDGKRGAGDLDGRGGANVIVDLDVDQVCFGITVMGIGAPVAAHIHTGTAGTNGAVVVTLVPPAGGDPGASSGCVGAAEALLRDILQHPHKYYVNVHNATFPGGALRGQLTRHSG